MVIPTNRVGPWMNAAVESVLSQVGVALELIVYLDAVDLPQDTGWSVDPRVKLIHAERSHGVGFALQVACETARGRYIARLDSDDIALPGRMALQVNYLDNHPETVAVSGQVAWVNDDGERIGAFGHRPGGDVRGRLLQQNVVVQSAVMFRREAYRAVGGYSQLRQMEDYDLWLRLAAVGKIANIDAMILEYRIHENQVSRGVHPRETYVKVIYRERRILARLLGKSRLSQLSRDVAFGTALYMMYYLPPALIRKIRALTSR
ncbi:glycosyltransferase [Specibacter sp. NPDC078709]|uniref:glycosyltransferase n=1 Tax=Specibacter sp. NPDC078709 TaxID=3154364 RepID=UPI00341AFE16